MIRRHIGEGVWRDKMIEKIYKKRLNKETQKQGQQWTNFWGCGTGGFYNDVASTYCEREGGGGGVKVEG